MNIKIKANHGVEMTEAIKNYVEEKVGEATAKFSQAMMVSVELEKKSNSSDSGDEFSVSGKVEISGKDIFVKSANADLYAAIDGLKDRLSNDLSKNKGKRLASFRKIGQRVKDMLKMN